MENVNLEQAGQVNENENMSKIEKKRDMSWIVMNIILRQAIVALPIYLIAFLVTGVVMAIGGINVDVFIQRAQSELEFGKQLEAIMQMAGVAIVALSYFGVRWGCKYVLSKAFIEEKEFGKLGYWVGAIPIIISIFIIREMMLGTLIFGIFLTPRLVKKWLLKFSKN